MRKAGNHRGARTISVALAAGLVAFEMGLALGAGNVGIPGVLLVRLADFTDSASRGGESLVAKQPLDPAFGKASRLDTPSSSTTGPLRDNSPSAVATTDLPPAVAEAERQVSLSAVPVVRSNGAVTPVVVDDALVSAQLASSLDMTSALAPLPKQAESEPAAKDTGAAEEKPQPAPKAPKMTEDLPWDAIQPVEVEHSPPREESSATTEADEKVKAWVRSKASVIEGAIDQNGRQHYSFELWIEPPAEVKLRLLGVAYDVASPSAKPRVQESREAQSGFRVRFGDLGCSDEILLTLKFDDGRSERVAVDGCKLPS